MVTAAQAVERLGALAGIRGRAAVDHAPAALLSFGTVLVLASNDGGYFPSEWGWSTVALVWIAAIALVLGRGAALVRQDRTLLGILAGLTAWTALSGLWADAVQAPVLEVERTLVYLVLVATLLIAARVGSAGAMLGGAALAGALVSGFALVTRLRPDLFGLYDDPVAHGRLYQPIGYWNALGIFAAMTAALCLGAAMRARTPWVRILGAAALPPVVSTLFFTFSRGSMMTLAIGVGVAVALDRDRLRSLAIALALAPWIALAIGEARLQGALAHGGAGVHAASSEGRPLLLVIALCAAAAGATMWGVGVVERRVTFGPAVRRAYLAVLALAAVCVLAGAVAVYGSPPHMISRVRHALEAKGPAKDVNQNLRLETLSLNGRPMLWRSALADVGDHPVLGSGAGTFEQYWNQHRPRNYVARDAHSLYLERLAEQGPVGLILVLALVLYPIGVAVRRRHDPLVLTALGALIAFALHAGFDWDWEMPAVMSLALVCAAAILVTSRPEFPQPLSNRMRAGLVAIGVAIGVGAFIGGVGNQAIAASADAAGQGNYTKAESEARTAMSWSPWSDQPWVDLGAALVGQGNRDAAAAALRTATRKNPYDWIAWRRLADVTVDPERFHALQMSARLNPKATRRSLGHEDRVRLGLTGNR
jgi:O-antigen ligase/polysaccharide polymerase Wzy-like membrane protein/tetratricopeptide repeat protein